MHLALLLGALIIFLKDVTIFAEIFTAIAEMEELLSTEAVLINNLQKYIDYEQEKIEFLKRKLQTYKREHSVAAEDVVKYLSNPINGYLLTKRLTVDWKEVETFMNADIGPALTLNVTKHHNTMKFPNEEDLNGAAVALVRLQDTYNLEASKLANGELNGVKYSTKMSASDCFELGRQSYINHDYYHTILWMQETMNRMTLEDKQTVTREDVLEYLAFSNFKEGNTKIALQMTNELLELIPNHERARGNKMYYEKELAKSSTRDNRDLKGDDDSNDMPVAEYEALLAHKLSLISYDATEKRLYEMMCRGEIERNAKELSSLKCMYITAKSSFLKIAPLKLEEINLRPYIALYHDVMYDNEIETIQQLAKPRFRRATVQNHKTGELETANYRISKSAWLKDEESKTVKVITRRLEDMTGLTMKTAEDLQIVNYGIGGHYEPHFDFARKEEKNAFKSLGTGNRIATVLFYMTDVLQGGATVFPHIRVSLWPKKGTAAFWYNLHDDGEGDYLTRHAACPVLSGTKWVSNRWIHERGQEFLRPCSLNPANQSST